MENNILTYITYMIHIVAVFLLFISPIFVWWIGDIYKWSNEIVLIISLVITIGTLLIELLYSLRSLSNRIERLYPTLNLSLEEQEEIHSLVSLKKSLIKKIDKPHVLIALEQFKKVMDILKAADNDSEFLVDNTFEANRLALKSMKKGQTFLGLSAIINSDYWNHDKQMVKYKELNYSQIKKGVIIKRIFVFNNEAEYKNMKAMMIEQAKNGVQAFFCFKDDLKNSNISYFSDFSVIEALNFCLIVPRESKLLTVTVSNSSELISECQSQFEKILKKSTKVEKKENED